MKATLFLSIATFLALTTTSGYAGRQQSENQLSSDTLQSKSMSFKEQVSIHDEETDSSSLDSIKMTEEEQAQAIEILSLYATPIDSSTLQRLTADAQAFIKMFSDTDDFDTSFYAENISHLESVVHYGIELAQQNKGAELLDLLEKEILNFYTNHNNTIDNELTLHQLLIDLYAKFYKGQDDVWQKVIPLVEFTKLHILSIQTLQGHIHPYYPQVLYSLIDAYMSVNDFEKAITTAKELGDCYQKLDNKPKYIEAIILLHDIYGEAGMQAQQDSCSKILEASPIYQDFLRELQQSKQQSTDEMF